MKFPVVLLLTATVIAVACGKSLPESEPPKEISWAAKQGNADLYLDLIVEEIIKSLTSNGMDSMALPEIDQEFSETFLGIEWHGEAQLYNGSMSGIQSMHRVGDAFLHVDGENSTITLSGALAFTDLLGSYAMHVGIMNIWVTAETMISISSIQVNLKTSIVLHPETNTLSIIVDELSVDTPGEITLDFSGLGSLDFILDALGSVLLEVFQDTLFSSLQEPVQQAIIDAVGENIDPNGFMDQMLESVGDTMISNGWDTYPLPDEVLGFSFEDFIGIEWHAEAMLINGFLKGLETIHRNQDISIYIDKKTNAIVVEAQIEFYDFQAGYDMYIGAMGIGLDVGMVATISAIEVFFKTSILITDEPVGNNKTSLARGIDISIDDLSIHNTFYTSVEFTGLGLLNIVLDALTFVVVNMFQGVVLYLMEGPVIDAIEQTIADLLPSKMLLTMLPTALLNQVV